MYNRDNIYLKPKFSFLHILPDTHLICIFQLYLITHLFPFLHTIPLFCPPSNLSLYLACSLTLSLDNSSEESDQALLHGSSRAHGGLALTAASNQAVRSLSPFLLLKQGAQTTSTTFPVASLTHGSGILIQSQPTR